MKKPYYHKQNMRPGEMGTIMAPAVLQAAAYPSNRYVYLADRQKTGLPFM